VLWRYVDLDVEYRKWSRFVFQCRVMNVCVCVCLYSDNHLDTMKSEGTLFVLFLINYVHIK
jgi:hypothetical protein